MNMKRSCAVDSFGFEHEFQKGLCMEREWSTDGDEQERRAYCRVRFVQTYDAFAAIMRKEMIPTGLRAEVW
jgi:hypothetical protein